MIDSKGSVIVSGQGSHDRLSRTPVVPDRGGQSEHPLQDPHGNTRHGASAVLFEVELALKVSLTDSMVCRIARSRP